MKIEAIMENNFRKGTFETSFKERKLYSNQVITVEDLFNFKLELLSEIEKLLKANIGQKDKKWLKSHQVRKLLNISAGTLQTLKASGVIPFTRIGGIHYYDSEQIQQILESGKTSRK